MRGFKAEPVNGASSLELSLIGLYFCWCRKVLKMSAWKAYVNLGRTCRSFGWSFFSSRTTRKGLASAGAGGRSWSLLLQNPVRILFPPQTLPGPDTSGIDNTCRLLFWPNISTGRDKVHPWSILVLGRACSRAKIGRVSISGHHISIPQRLCMCLTPTRFPPAFFPHRLSPARKVDC